MTDRVRLSVEFIRFLGTEHLTAFQIIPRHCESGMSPFAFRSLLDLFRMVSDLVELNTAAARLPAGSVVVELTEPSGE